MKKSGCAAAASSIFLSRSAMPSSKLTMTCTITRTTKLLASITARSRWLACHRLQEQGSMTLSDRESKSVVPCEGWILYDGGCGFCFRWVHLWEKVVGRRGFALKDLQSASAEGSLEISSENLLDDIRVLTRSGKIESGAGHIIHCTVNK